MAGKLTSLEGKVAAVTGAASGIGRALAVRLAQRGCHVALADVDAGGLEETAGRIGASGVRVTTHVVDVADRDAVEAWAQATTREHGGVDLIVSNAGVAAKGSIEQLSYADFDWVLGVNLWGVVHCTKAFLPLLRQRPAGHVVIVSSINARAPFPRNGPYNTSKSAVAALADTLWMELRGTPIGVSCVLPGGIRTDIVRRGRGMSESDVADFERSATISPERAAEVILNGVLRGRRIVYIGGLTRLLAGLSWLFPTGTLRLMAWIVRRREA